MLPVSLLPFPIPLDPAVIASILKGIFFLNPANILFIGLFILLWLSLKTMTAKLAFLGGSLLIASIMGYVMHRKEKQQKINKIEKKQLDLSDNFMDVSPMSQQKEEEQELMLSKMFKK